MSQTNNTTYVHVTADRAEKELGRFFYGKKNSNLLNKCYVCISIFKWFPFIFILGITIWSYYAYVNQLCWLTIKSTAVKTIYIIIFNILFFMTLWSYFQTVFTKSYLTPLSFFIYNEDYDRMRNENTIEKKNEILYDISKKRQLPLSCRTSSGAVRFCAECNLIKPDRTHHCSVCNKCILKYDHHCLWVNNCVSFSNYKFFILFLAYSFLMCLFGAVTSFNYFLDFWSNQVQTLGKFNILFLFFVSVMFSISIFSLFSYHIYLILRNLTTIENFRSPFFAYGPNKNAFNLGKLNNFKEVFGEKKLLWFLPIYTSLGNGFQFTSTDEHAKNLTQRIGRNILQQQQIHKEDNNELNEFKDSNSRLNNSPELNNETGFAIQMPGTTTEQ